MKRKIEKRKTTELELILIDCLKDIGIKATKDQACLLLRLMMSALGRHFFYNPDTEFQVGFMKFQKSPDIDELFNVHIIRSPENEVINAESLYRFYTGDVVREQQLRNTLDQFVSSLLQYSQQQEIDIMNTTSKITMANMKKRR